MASWGQNHFPRQKPVLKGPDDKLTTRSDSRKTEHVPGQKSHSGNRGGRSVGVAPDSPVTVRASLGPSGAWPSSPSSTGSSTVWPHTTLSLLTYSPNGKSRESGSQRQNPIPGQSLGTLSDFSGEDLGLSGQFDHQLLQRSLQECLEWEEPLSPVVKMLLQAFLKFQHSKSPWEIPDMRDPRSDMRQPFQVMLQDFPSSQLLLDGSLKSILQQYLSFWGQQPGWGEHQGKVLWPCLPPFYQQQPNGQWAGWREQQRQMPWPCVPTVQYQQQPQGQEPGQMLQPYLPPFWYQRLLLGQQPGRREQQRQMLQPCLSMVQYQQQPSQGEQQGQMLRPCLPPFWYQQQPHGQWAGWREQQGRMLRPCLPPFWYQQQTHGQWAGWREQKGQMLRPCLHPFWYQQQLSSEGQQSWEAATPSPPSQV